MKLTLSICLLLSIAAYANGLDCLTCSETNIDGELDFKGNCYSSVSTTNTNPQTCPANTPNGNTYYCGVEFTLTDGLLTGITRGCIRTDRDEDLSTATTMPATDKCYATFLSLGSTFNEISKCNVHCNTDNCNSVAATTIRPCSTNCSRDSSQGYCDYLTATCVCNTGFSGADCSTATSTTATYRSCVQCTSEKDTDCTTRTTGSNCPQSSAAQSFCYSTQTWVYNAAKTSVHNVMTRGCTTSFVATDQCTFTPIVNDNGINTYNEYTCTSTCNSDNCNTNTPNGVIDGTESIPLYCYVCSDTTGSGCSGQLEACSAGSTHCMSKVIYFTSAKNDLSFTTDPAYRLVSVERSCATAAVTKQCTDSTVATFNFKEVTCEETCQVDGCNRGWPARPKCLQCSTSLSDREDGYDTCLSNPAVATDCSFPYDEYCTIQDIGQEKSLRSSVLGYPRWISRGCSSYDIGGSCSAESIRGVDIQRCNYTCNTDGCNVGSGSSVPLQTVFAVVLPAIFGWFLQNKL